MNPITFVSDLHLDVNKKFNLDSHFLKAYEDFPGSLIIAGDTCEFRNFDSFFYFVFDRLFKLNKDIQVFYVAGNHEYYGGSIEEVNRALTDYADKNHRFHFLNNLGCFTFRSQDLISIAGSSLWYPDTPDSWILQNNINDFSQIKEFKPNTAHQLNKESHEFFRSTYLEKDNFNIWVVHHLPSSKSIGSRFKGDRLNCYFVDHNFEKLIEEKQPDVVIHGHGHNPVNYKIGNTWVLSNPHGYGQENKDFNWFKHTLWT
jgi:predicted MPP superfamily phosphohydrolase